MHHHGEIERLSGIEVELYNINSFISVAFLKWQDLAGHSTRQSICPKRKKKKLYSVPTSHSALGQVHWLLVRPMAQA